MLEPEIAVRQLSRIEKGILSLYEMPERFHMLEKEPWHSRGLRLECFYEMLHGIYKNL